MDTPLYNLIALGLVLGILLGIKLMSSPATAVRGNLLGALCILGGILLTLARHGLLVRGDLWAAMALGAGAGVVLAAKATMIRMPEIVALLNGLGGGASALVALTLFLDQAENPDTISRFAGALALAVGGITFSGSLVAAGKLAKTLPQRPVIFRNHTTLSSAILCAGIVAVLLAAAWRGGHGLTAALATLVLALGFGIVFAIRVGGADMPITISLLNSLSGVAASIAGLALYNPLLVAVGAIVGAAGLILTQIMCRAMNRSLVEIIAGRTVLAANTSGGQVAVADEAEAPDESSTAPVSIPDLLQQAARVVIVPGYGMALAQAQEPVKGLLDALQRAGKEVKFAIHPVAGRMPGHMNVLLAEVDVPYELLAEIDDVNPEFPETDLVIVVGANDVVNPAAATAQGTPIYGMPILEVGKARHVLVCNLDDKPGYAGVNNSLYAQRNVTTCFGDAKETVAQLIAQLTPSCDSPKA